MRSFASAISVDLDSLPHYCRIHGLPESILDARARALVHQVAIPRFLELFSECGVPATFFAIGEDLAEPGAAEALRAAARLGVEVASHSHSHDYALSRRPLPDLEVELARSAQAIQAAVGRAPVGFRAPGYTLSPALYCALFAAGYRYDSSVFPAAPYYGAKALVMGLLSALGRPSRAVLDTPRVLLAPLVPYWPDPTQPYRRGAGEVLELPVSVEPLTRVPFIGTVAVGLPSAALRPLYRGARRLPLLNFELHAVDLLDGSDGINEALVRQQRDLRLSASTKRRRLREVFRWLAEDGPVLTLAEAAKRFAPPREV